MSADWLKNSYHMIKRCHRFGLALSALLMLTQLGCSALLSSVSSVSRNLPSVDRGSVTPVGPVVTIVSPAANTPVKSGLLMAGTCQTGLSIAFSGTGMLGNINGTCYNGNYSQFVYFSPGDGPKVVLLSQTDAAGNSGTATRTFVLDTTPPALTQTLLASPTYSATNSVSFGGACETGLNVLVSGTSTGSAACVAGVWTYATPAINVDGSYNYVFTQTDLAGNAASISSTWVRETSPPTFNFTSASSFTTSGNAVTFNGYCVSGLSITVNGAGGLTCSGGLWSYTASSSVDGTFTYNFAETDFAGNVATLTGSWTRNTVGPVLTITQSSPAISTGNTYIISGTCSGGSSGSNGVIAISGAVNTTTMCSSNNATLGTWSYTASESSDSAYNYTFTTTDNFVIPRSTSASFIWDRDTTPPAATAASFQINGGNGTSTPVSYNSVAFSATDNVSSVASFCLKTANSPPLASDSCWYPVNGSETNITPSNSVAISGYQFNIGITPQTYTVYLWLMDGAGNISTNSGTASKDMVTITLAPTAPPSASTVLVGNSDTMNGLVSERTITGGSDVYVRWTASGPSLGANPVQLYFTTDDVHWTLFANGLANGANDCTSITGSGSASTAATGCYKWSGGSPSSSYFRVRVAITNSVGGLTFANSLPVNSPAMQVIAGNTESGLNGSAGSAIFQNDISKIYTDNPSLVVANDGTLYFRDVNNGIVYVKPSDGILRQLIPLGATTSGYGDGGPASLAKLRMPSTMALDYQGRLLVIDYDRIRRIDLTQNPPTINTLIGGGSTTSDTVANPLSLQIASYNAFGFDSNNLQNMLHVLPNGDIYFFTET